MLRTFLIENESKQRAIVTELELPKTPDWRVVRELLSLADPIRQAEVLHSAVATLEAESGAGGLIAGGVTPKQSQATAEPALGFGLLLAIGAAAFLFLRK